MKVFVMNKKRAVSYLALIFCAVCILTIGTLQSADVWNDGGDKLLPIYSVEKGNEKVCALTFDAAWDDADTDVLINILKNITCRLRFLWWAAGWKNIPNQ